jgi:hypothetical protein
MDWISRRILIIRGIKPSRIPRSMRKTWVGQLPKEVQLSGLNIEKKANKECCY